MTESLILKQMANLLMIKGKSADEARSLVNRSQHAQNQKIEIAVDEIQDIHSIEALNEDMKGIKSVTDNFSGQFTNYDNFAQSAMDLRQRRALLISSWDTFKVLRLSSALYLSLLSLIIYNLQIFVLPTFTEMYVNNGEKLPELTRFVFTEGYFAVSFLLLLWLLAMGNLVLITVVGFRISKFALLPSWFLNVPLIGSVYRSINQCILLSLYSFLSLSRSFVLPERNEWQSQFGLSKKNSCYEWANQTYENIKFAIELNISNEYLVEELDLCCERFIDKTARSMKMFSLISSAVIAAFIILTVIAMYLPIFSMGMLI